MCKVAYGQGPILTLPAERRSPTRQVFKSTPKPAGSEIGALRCQSSRGQCQEAPYGRQETGFGWTKRRPQLMIC